MSFYQNPFDQLFTGKFNVLTFDCPPNKNSPNYMLAWNAETYNLSVDDTLTLNYAWDTNFKNYSALDVVVAGVTPAATTAAEVITALNANATFADMFLASTKTINNHPTLIITAKSGRVKQVIRAYISNSSAEKQLGFNKKAGVAELPTAFERDTIANRFAYPDGVGMLIHLDESDPVDQAIIENAGFVPANMLADWQLLQGKAQNLFMFRKITVDGSNRITQIIEYGAGSIAGDFAKKTNYLYFGTNTNPYQITEIPYVLTSGDLVTPP